MKLEAILPVVLVGALGCASASRSTKGPKPPSGARPEWVSGTSREFPREMYLVGVGQGDDQASAQDRARAEISKIFSTRVSVTGDVTTSETGKSQGGGVATSFSQTVTESVHTASQKVVEGVSIAETWQDPATRSYYALAALDRAQGAASLRDRIADFDKQMDQWKRGFDQTSDRFAKMQAAMKLLALSKARGELDGEYRVLDSAGKGIPSAMDMAAIAGQAARTLSELDILVKASGAGEETLKTGVVGGLTKVGLSARDDGGAAPDILVEAVSESRALDIKSAEGWRYNLSSATVSLKDAKAGRIFLRFDLSDRAASASAAEAARRSAQKLSAKVAERVEQGIRSYFENQ